jgi:hypothetical protein
MDLTVGDYCGPLAAARREIHEEYGVESDQIAELRCLGLVRNRTTLKPEFLTEATVSLDSGEFRTMTNREYSGLSMIDPAIEALTAFLNENARIMTSPGLACLLAVGRRRYGDTWHTEMCSQLRTLFRSANSHLTNVGSQRPMSIPSR